LYWKGSSASVKTDASTLCPVDRPPAAVVVLLLDVSDEYTEAQRLALGNQVERLRASIPRLGLLEVYTVNRLGRSLSEPVLHICNPGDGATLNRLYQNPEFARKRWMAFARELESVVEREASGGGLEYSPIFEAIQATALRTYGSAKYDHTPKRLVLVSDLMQNTPGGLNMYDGLPSFEDFANSPYYDQVRASLSDVVVTIQYLVRPSVSVQGRAHVGFWESYFSAQGATVESVEKVFGGQ